MWLVKFCLPPSFLEQLDKLALQPQSRSYYPAWFRKLAIQQLLEKLEEELKEKMKGDAIYPQFSIERPIYGYYVHATG